MSDSSHILLSHPTGNANARQILKMLQGHSALAGLATSIIWQPESLIARRLPTSLREQLSRREFELSNAPVITKPLPELARLLASRFGIHWLGRHFSVDHIYRGLDNKVAKALQTLQPSAVYCYEDGALKTFQRAQALGIQRIYDLPIAYWERSRAIMQEEAERLPEWAITIHGMDDSPEKLERKVQEIELADTIVSPSQFVYDSLPEHIRQNKDCIIARFGCHLNSPLKSRPTPKEGPLRVLFAGSLTQRKGLADLFKAVQQLPSTDIELVVMGSLCAPIEFYRAQYADFVYEPPRPHAKVLELMASCDLFVLPSLVEGRALVQLEALGIGLPLIISTNTGGEDLIAQETTTGFSIDIRSPDQIAERLQWFIDHREQLDPIKEDCRRHAQSITWETYRETVSQAILS